MLRYNYAKDSDTDLLQTASDIKFSSRLPVCALELKPAAISPENSDWLHCVSATKNENKIRLRVITNTHRGINVTVPCLADAMYYKYLDLRFQIRNCEYVQITFPAIYVKASSHNKRELYLLAYDFKMMNPNDSETLPTLLI